MLTPLIENLYSTLKSIQESTIKILELEDQKYDIIKNMEMDQLIFLNEEESMYIQKIENAENSRIQIMEQLAPSLECSVDVSLSDFIVFLPKEHQETFQILCTETKELCKRLSVVTERNEYVLKTHSEIIGQILELTQELPVDQYNSQGLSTERKQHSLHMLDQLI